MLVVQEDNKFEPLVAALKGSFASHLVVTTSMARRILDRWSKDGLEKAVHARLESGKFGSVDAGRAGLSGG